MVLTITPLYAEEVGHPSAHRCLTGFQGHLEPLATWDIPMAEGPPLDAVSVHGAQPSPEDLSGWPRAHRTQARPTADCESPVPGIMKQKGPSVGCEVT